MPKISFLIFIIAAFVCVGCAKKGGSSPAKAEKAPAGTEAKQSSGAPAKTTAAAATAKKETSPAPTVSAQGFTVLQAEVCRSVENREPVGGDTKFPADVARLYFYSKLALEASNEVQVHHVWRYQGKEMARVTLPVRGPQWRTYSSKTIENSQKGEWSVDLTAGDGTVLKSVGFKVE